MTREECLERDCVWARAAPGEPWCTQKGNIGPGPAVDEQPPAIRTRNGRKTILMTLLYGDKWADLLHMFLKRRWGFGHEHILVVAIGDDALKACLDGQQKGRVECWSPNAESQIHRFTIIQIMLHLGVDVMFFDMDTFMFQDPYTLLANTAAENNTDVIFASHADGDCVNIGVFYMRSSSEVSRWFESFLDWYYKHSYEIDQRGFNAFLRHSKKIGVSFMPSDLPEVSHTVLDDVNEVTIMKLGWTGSYENMHIAHWAASNFTVKSRHPCSVRGRGRSSAERAA
jgi:hypothetical protein